MDVQTNYYLGNLRPMTRLSFETCLYLHECGMTKKNKNYLCKYCTGRVIIMKTH